MKIKSEESKYILFSKNNIVQESLSLMKNQYKTYNKILSALRLLGDFNEKIDVDLYEIIEEDIQKKIKLSCFDLNDNLFIFYGQSSNKNEILKIKKFIGNQEYEYDIALAKKYKLNEENIEFIRTGNVLNFKFGRLVTDKNSFYSILLGEDVGYQIKGDFSQDLTSHILNEINRLDKSPNLQTYLEIFKNILEKKQIKYTTVNISAFKNYEQIAFLQIKEENVQKDSTTIKKLDLS